MKKSYLSDADDDGREGREEKLVLYGVEDTPAVHLCFLFGLQQAIMTIGGVLSIPFILSRLLCVEDRNDVTSTLLSITMFMCGVATVLQNTFGIRLGIIQGGSHTFIAPIVAMMALDKWQCHNTGGSGGGINGTVTDDDWKVRMREIQGNLIVASLTQLFLGCTGLMGFFLQFIGPLTIAPTISLIGLSLTGVATDFNKIHWGIAFLSMALIIVFSLYCGRIKIPVPAWTRHRGCHFLPYPIFQLFPVILSIGVSWIVCVILTTTDTVPNNSTHPNYQTRTDARLYVLDKAPWFYWPYPFQFGVPTVSAAGYVGFLAATLSSIIESIGDYYAAARISGAPPPPSHAVNRGIAMEGFCSIISGLVGAGHATTSYSGNIGAIGITKVASRRVFQTAGLIMIVCGVIGKFGAVLTLIPEPIIGGTLTVVFGMVAAVGISTLKFIDMGSTRNLTILGLSLLLGLMVPQYINAKENANIINTGNEEFDQVVKVMLGTAMFVGGIIGFILDNTVPGTTEERGLLSWRKSLIDERHTENKDLQIYEFPYVTKYMRRVKCCSYVPILPTFDKEIKVNCNCCKRTELNEKTSHSNFAYDNDIVVSEENSQDTSRNGKVPNGKEVGDSSTRM